MREYKVFRGGSWGSDEWTCRSAIRDRDDPVKRDYLGFRVAQAKEGNILAVKGGSCFAKALSCRSPYRLRWRPHGCGILGFRLASDHIYSYTLRGGSWFTIDRGCRSACNSRIYPSYSVNSVGFRVSEVL